MTNSGTDITLERITCGGCGYPLSGLEGCSKCPECGFDVRESVRLHNDAFLTPMQARKLARRLRLLSVLQIAAGPTIVLWFLPDIVSKALGGIPGTASWNRGQMSIMLFGSALLFAIRIAYFAVELARVPKAQARMRLALAAVRCALGLSVLIWAVRRWDYSSPANTFTDSDSTFLLIFGLLFTMTGLGELALGTRTISRTLPELSPRVLILNSVGYALTLPAFLVFIPMCVFGLFVLLSPVGCLCLGAANWLMARQVEDRFGSPFRPPA